MDTEAVCLSCLKWFDVKPNANLSICDGSQHTQLYRRFLEFAREHLKLVPGVLNALGSALVSSVRGDGGSGVEEATPPVFCVECENTLIVICNLYDGLCEVQLQLARKVGRLAGLLERAKEEQGRSGEEEWNRGLLLHLATQMGLKGGEEEVNRIRNQMAIKCKLKAICHVRARKPEALKRTLPGSSLSSSSKKPTMGKAPPTTSKKTESTSTSKSNPPCTIKRGVSSIVIEKTQGKIGQVDVIPLKKVQGTGKPNKDEKEPSTSDLATITEVKQERIEEEEEQMDQGWPGDDPLNRGDSLDNSNYADNSNSSSSFQPFNFNFNRNRNGTIIIQPKEEEEGMGELFIDENEYGDGSYGGSQGDMSHDGSMILPLDVSIEEVEDHDHDHNSSGHYSDSPTAHCSIVSVTGNHDGSSPQRKRQKKHPRPVMDPTAIPDDTPAFVDFFKRRRMELKLTQSGVAMSLGNMYGRDSELFSQTTVSRFEAMNLTKSNMEKLRPLFQKWLLEADPRTFSSVQHLPLPNAGGLEKRKKRTSIPQELYQALDDYFQRNQRPNADEIAELANQFHIEKEVIRVWFCNRRQKEKRAASSQSLQELMESHSHSQQQSYTYQYQKQQDGGALHVVVTSTPPPPPPLKRAPKSSRSSSSSDIPPPNVIVGSSQLPLEPVTVPINPFINLG